MHTLLTRDQAVEVAGNYLVSLADERSKHLWNQAGLIFDGIDYQMTQILAVVDESDGVGLRLQKLESEGKFVGYRVIESVACEFD